MIFFLAILVLWAVFIFGFVWGSWWTGTMYERIEREERR